MVTKLNYESVARELGQVFDKPINPQVFEKLESKFGSNEAEPLVIIPGESRLRGYSHAFAPKGHDVTLKLNMLIRHPNSQWNLTFNGAEVQWISYEFNKEVKCHRDVVEIALGNLADMIKHPDNYESSSRTLIYYNEI